MILENIADLFKILPPERPIMAFDMGLKRIGVACSDPRQVIAFPRLVYERVNMRQDIGFLSRICRDEKAAAIVMGLPLDLENREGGNCEWIREFAVKLEYKTDLPILLMDERLSTAAVTRAMKEADISRKERHEKDDKLAAAYILQTVLDSRS